MEGQGGWTCQYMYRGSCYTPWSLKSGSEASRVAASAAKLGAGTSATHSEQGQSNVHNANKIA